MNNQNEDEEHIDPTEPYENEIEYPDEDMQENTQEEQPYPIVGHTLFLGEEGAGHGTMLSGRERERERERDLGHPSTENRPGSN